ncbi:S-layer homology domain-containing protein [Candidatus Margulisiibacteriota bacterium]
MLDPTKLGLGARSVSLGRCSATLFHDPNSAIVNPALAVELKDWGVSSMYVNLSEDIAYTQLGLAFPRDGEALGLSFLGATSGGIIATTVEAGRIEPSGFTFDYSSAVISVIYARRINEKLSAGAALKHFSRNFTSVAQGNGYDIDLGLLYKVNEKLTLGLVQQNTLPSSIARMQWDTGHSEGIPHNTKLGLSYQDGDMLAAADADRAADRPLLLHGGVEWGPLWKFLFIRGGFDQYPENKTTAVTSFTLGLGVKIAGLGFDYAYYNDALLQHSVAHYFSFSYQPPTRAEVRIAKEAVEKQPAEPPAPAIELKSFPDVPEDYFAYEAISYLATADIITGFPDGTFRPEVPLTRAQMAKLLVTTAGLGVPEKVERTAFPDVAPDHWAAPYIVKAYEQGWLKGYLDKTFRPNRVLSRAEGVALLATFDRIKVPLQVTRNTYTDVPTAFWAARAILGAKEAGWLDYIKTAEFKPKDGFLRAEAAYLLYRTTAGQQAVRKLKP